MKKFLYAFLTAIILCTAFAVTSSAYVVESGSCGTNVVYTLDSYGVLTISGSGSMSNYEYNTMPWYSRRSFVKTVIIKNGVTSIGSYAFYECNITSITIPDSVTSIGIGPFFRCSTLNEVQITDVKTWCNIKFKSYDSNPLYYANNLYLNGNIITELVIPDSVSSISDYAFLGCTGLTSITIPDSVSSIGSSAFSNTAYYNDANNWENGVLYIGNHLIKADTNISGSYTINNGTKCIAGSAFYDCTSLTSITIPDSVTSIGSDAFYSCDSLIKVEFEKDSTLTSIGSDAFRDCSSLTSITIPDSVTSIGENAFFYCDSLVEITLPFIGEFKDGSGNRRFGHLFSRYSYNVSDDIPKNLKKVTITGGTSIYSSAFEDCNRLENIIIPDSVTSIGNYAFHGCSSLTSITIPDSVTSIGYDAFSNCSSLTTIEIPDGITQIASYTFAYCENLTSIKLPKNLTVIGNYTFYDCEKLTSITIPEYVTSIGEHSFTGTLISIVNFNGSAPTISGGYNYNFVVYYKDDSEGFTTPTWNGYPCYPIGDFDNLDLTILDDNNLNAQGIYFTLDDELLTATVGNNTSSSNNSLYYGIGVGKVIIPDYVTKDGNTYTVSAISQYAFYDCGVLTSIYIPETVTSIGKNAFHGAYNNQSFTVAEDNPAFVSVDGVIFNKPMTNLRYYPAGNERKSYEIPDSVISVTTGAFYGANNLEEMTLSAESQSFATLFDGLANIPSSLKKVILKGESVASSAFYDCDTIYQVVLTDSVKEVNYQAFYSCSKLNKLYVGANVSFFSTGVFYGCSNLDEVYVSDLSAWCSITFGESYYYGSYYTSNPFYQGAGLYVNGELITDLVIPDDVTSISARAFSNTNLTSVTIPSSVKSIGSDAFYECTSLETVSVDSIDTWCHIDFYNQQANPLYYADELLVNSEVVTSVIIPDDITSINRYAFLGYEKLTSISFPDSITAIESSSFSGCTSLKLVELSKNTTTIGADAFSGCSNLLKIVIPTTANKISIATTAIPEVTTIYGTTGSAVEAFANANGYTFVPMGNSVYAIRYNANGGTNAPINATKGMDMEYTISSQLPTKGHATFVGWSTIKNGEVVYYPGDKYTANASVTLFAVWQEPQVVIDDITVTPGVSFYVDLVVENSVPIKAMTINNIEYSDVLTLTNAEWLLTDSTLSQVDVSGDSLIAFENAVEANKAVMRLYFTVDSELEDQEAYISFNAKGTDEENETFDFVSCEGKVNIRNFTPGDFDGDQIVTIDDAIYLAFSTFYPDRYSIPIGMDVDFNNDGEDNIDDAIYLAFRTFYPDRYPIN